MPTGVLNPEKIATKTLCHMGQMWMWEVEAGGGGVGVGAGCGSRGRRVGCECGG